MRAQFFALRCNPRRHPSATVGDKIPALARADRAESVWSMSNQDWADRQSDRG
jgi:hypothetical protein